MKVLYIDKDIAVIDKPCGLLSVPYEGSSGRTALSLLESYMRKRGLYTQGHKPFAVHRLDRDTSGVMMFALSRRIKDAVMKQWQTMVTERLYIAVAKNPQKRQPCAESGTINTPIAFNAHKSGYVPLAQSSARTLSAITHYRVVARGKTHTLFCLSLDTGRKNQIRAHLESIGYTICGDKSHGSKDNPFERLALHARTLSFSHPTTHASMRFEIPEPTNWEAFVKQQKPLT